MELQNTGTTEEWAKKISSDDGLHSFEQWQAIRILKDIPPNTFSVCFFCPTKSFRKLFGDIPKLLEERGYHVIHLYGERVGDDFEDRSFSYFAGGTLVKKLVFIDLFVVPTIMDCLPEGSLKMLLLHTGFGGVSFPTYEKKPASNETQGVRSAEELTETFTHMTAFMPLYDYVTAASTDVKNRFIQNLQRFNHPFNGPNFIKAAFQHPKKDDLECLMQNLKRRRLAKAQCIIPLGYPSFDQGFRNAQKSTVKRDCITYAPTPMIGKEHWWPYTSTWKHGPEIVESLCKAFSDYKIVFKSYHDEKKCFLEPIISTGKKYKNFVHDESGGSYHELYERTAVMISDFSGAAFTFSLAHSRPTIFFSHNETKLPDVTKDSEYTKSRCQIGEIVQNCEELTGAVAHALENSSIYMGRINALRKVALYNVGNSSEYLASSIHHIFSGIKHRDWIYFGGNYLQKKDPYIKGDEQEWRQAAKDSVDGAAALVCKIKDLIAKKKYDEIFRYAREALIEFPYDEKLAVIVGLLMFKTGNFPIAIEVFGRASELSPKNPTYKQLRNKSIAGLSK